MLLSGIRCTTPSLLLQLVIFLYLLDSETSYVVIASSGIGTVIEFWKVTKAMNVTIDRSRGYPMIKFEDKAGEQQHDLTSLEYLLLLFTIILCCYSLLSIAIFLL